MRRRHAWIAALIGLPLVAGAAAAGVSEALAPAAVGAPADEIREGGSADAALVGTGAASGSTGSTTAGIEPGEIPVLLVPGWLDTARELAALRIRLMGAGWPGDHVETITFREPTGSNRDHAEELAAAVDLLRERTGAEQVDIVAHSMGGLATRWYLHTHGGAPVRRVVFIASPHRGTLSAHLAWGGGREEMMPGSALLDTLNSEAPTPEGVEAMTVRTMVDTHIVPGESATLPGVVDHEVCCPTHAGLLRDDEVFQIVLDFLEGR